MARALDSPALPSAPARGFGARVRGAFGRVGRSLGLTGDASLARRFLVASAVVLLVGGVAIGLWVGSQLQRGIIDRTASITALYVQSFIEPHLASMAAGEWLSSDDKAQLDSLLTNTSSFPTPARASNTSTRMSRRICLPMLGKDWRTESWSSIENARRIDRC